MAGIVKMLHRFNQSYDSHIITIHMPTERERDYHNPELKSTDEPYMRLKFLDKINWDVSIFILILAIVGLYSIIF